MENYIKIYENNAKFTQDINKGEINYIQDSDSIIATHPSIEFVDLGLPSGTQWMKYNIGAESETDYGKYFQWGDTVGYTDASHSTWSTCPFNNGSSSCDSSYFTANSGTWLTSDAVLKLEYDAAYQATNGQARMPTEAELNELIANTISEWTTLNGVNGRKYTSTKEGYTDKYIFIPAAGYAESGAVGAQGGGGYLWSSHLIDRYDSALLAFDDELGLNTILYTNRSTSFPTRGVKI